ncbi:MAG: Fe-S protein assembly co-chaperone HscB [Saprospiraceae bacterium]|nr:Fe-S protein assembly co-chaperone HscB [Saprospiraceae bacterium]
MTYFEFYGLPQTLNLDEGQLRRLFYQKSKEHHPDVHTLANEDVQAQNLDLASFNNDAYRTLSNPTLRLKYVLQLHGLLGDEKQLTKLPADFLMEMMELNETMADLEFEPNPEKLNKLNRDVDELEQSLDNQINTLLLQWSIETNQPGDLEKLQDYFLKKRYLLRIRENLSKFASL